MRAAEDYLDKLDAALRAAGKDPLTPTVEDLAPADQFHMRGTAATLDVIKGLKLTAEDHLLDVGCGLGGPARLAAARTGCRVTGVDPDALSITAGAELTRRCCLQEQVSLISQSISGVALTHFTAAWTIHVGMFVADKPAFYAEIFRLLPPGGRFVLYDPVRTGAEDHLYPVPWATAPDGNHISDLASLTRDLETVGFQITDIISKGPTCRDWFEGLAAKGKGAKSPLGMHLLVGPAFREMSLNAYKSLKAARIDFVEIYAAKP